VSIDIRASQGEHQARPSEVTQIELVAKSGETNDASKPAKAGGFNGFITTELILIGQMSHTV